MLACDSIAGHSEFMNGKIPTRPNNNGHAKRHAARIAMVQALYQHDQTQTSLNQIKNEFLIHRPSVKTDLDAESPMENEYFSHLMTIVEERIEDIDRLITASIEPDWTLSRLEPVLRSILRGGCAEFLADKGIPPAVVINEYVTIAHEFYGGKEPAFVNGILQTIAASLGYALKTRRSSAEDQQHSS